MRDQDKTHEELLQELVALRARFSRLVRGEEASAVESREPRLRTLLENSPDIITVLDLDAYVVYQNRTVGDRRLEDSLGTRSIDHMAAPEAERFMTAFTAALGTGETQQFEVSTTAGYVWNTRLVPLREHGHTFAVMGIGTDITERRRAEKALLESEEKLRLAVSATGIGLWRWNPETGGITWDGTMAELLGVQPCELPRDLRAYEERVHPEDRARVAAAFHDLRERGVCDGLEHRVVTPAGDVHTLVWKGSGIRGADGNLNVVLGGVYDLTERKRLEEQLRQAQKMEALGQLTAGIAHNFNNMLTVILSNLHLGMPMAGEAVRGRLKDAEHAARRAADMVRELMVFARRYPIASKRTLDVREVAMRTVEICRTTFDKSIEVRFDAPAQQKFDVLADPGQLEQVLLNICLNARDALETQTEPRPRIELRLDAVTVVAADGGSAERVRLVIEDNGPGMPEEVRRRIFEPFFTTKEVGRGTGLGLATAYGIVVDHGGQIECETRSGGGAKFRVWLPRAPESEEAPGAFSERPASNTSELLLLVEDEDMVRKTTAAVLASGGYEVLQASSGEHALALYEQHAARVRLVVLDWSMPRVSGEHVLAELVRRWPQVRVVLFSGQYPDGVMPANVRGIIQKPAPVETLLATVRDALDS